MKVRLVVILLFIAVVTIALLLVFFREVKQGTLAFEIAKSLLQLGVVAVVGALVSLAMTDYQLEQSRRDKDRDHQHQNNSKERDIERQRSEYREDLLTATLSRTVSAYSRAKKARRLLRARFGVAPGGPGLIRLDDYDHFMEMVNDAQLELESLKGDVKTSNPAFSSANSVVTLYESMEGYLNGLVKEYERSRHTITDSKRSIPVAQLEALSDFLGTADPANKFKRQVIDPYHQIQEFIRADLLHPKLPR
jgi:hypothetical protein